MANENKKKNKYPEGYIGRPKAMKTKKIEFHKPTTKFYVELGIFLAIAAFLTYIVIRLINVEKQTEKQKIELTINLKTLCFIIASPVNPCKTRHHLIVPISKSLFLHL